MEALRVSISQPCKWIGGGVVSLLLLAVLMGGERCRAAQDSLTVTTNHYLVAGSTLREIRQSINRVRPGGEKAGHDALTAWKVGWNVRFGSVAGEYRVTSFTTTTTIVITMPSWRAPTNAAPAVLGKWMSYYSALQKHESTHATNGMLAAEALRQRVRELGPDSDHKRLQQRVQVVADTTIEEFKKRDKDFDRETNHGRKDGASLP
jgi:predicted secreted Zn-dependent protease